MSRTIGSRGTDAFADELAPPTLSNLRDGPLKKLDQPMDWEQS